MSREDWVTTTAFAADPERQARIRAHARRVAAEMRRLGLAIKADVPAVAVREVIVACACGAAVNAFGAPHRGWRRAAGCRLGWRCPACLKVE